MDDNTAAVALDQQSEEIKSNEDDPMETQVNNDGNIEVSVKKKE